MPSSGPSQDFSVSPFWLPTHSEGPQGVWTLEWGKRAIPWTTPVPSTPFSGCQNGGGGHLTLRSVEEKMASLPGP